ncbi:hypothetical protein HNR00_002820 [Methylorubrum rhodinum]|uniref:Uncharacterized protein n=1 Tax=Methylorubrum rhodinum TaxID=29428 RepID=A0A840ZJ48_9HYPH|nr:hypothetical protein [Methylorubrum rhodinum]
MSWMRLGVTGLLGALAGMVLFPRPARGKANDGGVRADPPAGAPDRRPPGG